MNSRDHTKNEVLITCVLAFLLTFMLVGVVGTVVGIIVGVLFAIFATLEVLATITVFAVASVFTLKLLGAIIAFPIGLIAAGLFWVFVYKFFNRG